jgi:very-short-patch-repair endonuclease
MYASKAEARTAKWLEDNNIKFEYGKSFEDCLSNKNCKLYYDFYLTELNTLIEIDGEQHVKPVKFFGGLSRFAVQHQHDNTKKLYCETKGIRLIRIKYNEEVEDSLYDQLKENMMDRTTNEMRDEEALA